MNKNKNEPKRYTRASGLLSKQVTINGNRKVFYGHSDAEITQKMLEYKGEAAAGPMFSEVADKWWDQASKSIKYGTARSYKSSYDAAVSYFNGSRIKEIKPKNISDYLKHEKIKGLAQATLRNRHSVLNLIFEYWCSEMDGEINPSISVKNLKGDKSERIPPNEKTMDLILSHTSGEMGLTACFAMYAGMRLGEILALEWSDIDVQNETVSVTKSVSWRNNRPEITTPKTKNSVRTIPMLDPLKKRILEESSHGKYVIGENDIPLTASQYRKRWLAYCKNIGMAHQEDTDYKTYDGKRQIHWNVDVTAHQLRHYCATLLDKADVPMKSRQLWLGHADIHTTMQIYTHGWDGQMQEAANDVNALFATQHTSNTH